MDRPGIDALILADSRAALNVPETPAYVYSESVLSHTASNALDLTDQAGCKLVYTLKPCGLSGVLDTLSPYVDGYAASSMFEVLLAREVALSGQTIHCYSPAFSAGELNDVLSMANYVSLNSVTQLEMAMSPDNGNASIGLRVNPEVRFAGDSRYDPCRPYSKLGVAKSDFQELVGSSHTRPLIEGVHIHNNCESDDLTQLAISVESILETLRVLDGLTWVNLGGGYYLGPEVDPGPLAEVVHRLTSEFGVSVFVEPGTALVQQAGLLISEVLDVFKSGGKQVAVLDATTSQMPEVFEYGFTPSITGLAVGGDSITILAGKSCLAGDVFGEYSLQEPPGVGDRVAIMDAGSYSQSRAVPFNGIPIPSCYLLREDGSFALMASYGYRDFAGRNGVVAVAVA